jgi:hypothetical protein
LTPYTPKNYHLSQNKNGKLCLLENKLPAFLCTFVHELSCITKSLNRSESLALINSKIPLSKNTHPKSLTPNDFGASFSESAKYSLNKKIL